MSNDRVLAANYNRIIPALVEHTHFHTQYTGKIYGTTHSSFIRADDHQMLTVYLNVIYVGEQCLDKLVSRLHGVEAG